MTEPSHNPMQTALVQRFSDAPAIPEGIAGITALSAMAGRGSCRAFRQEPVPDDLLATLCAIALSAPSKSDLQQRDIILLRAPHKRRALAELVSGQAWVAGAPMIAVVCANNRRQRLLHDWRGIPFENDHFDAPFNAATDAAIALGALTIAAEAAGLGCCPISAVRNRAKEVSDLLELPQHVFPFAGLAIGYPAQTPQITPRLPLSVTCHTDRYCEDGVQAAVDAYDTRRQDFTEQRFADVFGTADSYGWSDDKVRQYSQPERAGFGAFLRRKGFCLD